MNEQDESEPRVSIKASRIPAVTTEQMRRIDNLMVEDYGIQLIQMMENAGLNLARLVRRLLKNSVLKKHVAVAVGKGNNGGGGMVAARHLYNWGAKVTVLLEAKDTLSEVPEVQWKALKALPINKKTGEAALRFSSHTEADMVIDALIGYGLTGRPHGWASKMIEKINTLSVLTVALDVPSGLDATTGEVYDPCIRANATVTPALPKTGLIKPEANAVVGSLYLADIGVPDVLYREMGIDIRPLFTQDTLIHVEM